MSRRTSFLSALLLAFSAALAGCRAEEPKENVTAPAETPPVSGESPPENLFKAESGVVPRKIR